MGLAEVKASQAVASTAGNQQSTSGSEEEEESEVIFFRLPICFRKLFCNCFQNLLPNRFYNCFSIFLGRE
jgi:hypothetical protein